MNENLDGKCISQYFTTHHLTVKLNKQYESRFSRSNILIGHRR